MAGWLLMNPRGVKQPDGKIVWADKAPIREWNQLGAFDSAAECESEKWEMINHFTEPRASAIRETYLGARCVPAEHVYGPPAKDAK